MTNRKMALGCTAALAGCTGLWIASCVIPEPSVVFTIGGKTITLKLGPGGVFNLTPGATVLKIVDALGFLGGAPTDSPSGGTIRLRASSVTVRSPVSDKGAVAFQAVSGIARLRVSVDAPGAVDPCETGIELGTYEIHVEPNGVINVVDENLALTLSALSLFLRDNISMCLQMETDFAGTIEISGLDLIFGPSEDIPPGRSLVTARFTLINAAATRIHIVAPGEQTDRNNLLTPGMDRLKFFDNLLINDLVTFRAERCDGFTDLIGGPDDNASSAATCSGADVLDTVTCPRIDQGDFFAVVLWDGSRLTCDQPNLSPDLGPDLACCSEEGECKMTSWFECFAMFDFTGVPMDEGTDCSSFECPVPEEDPREACCLPPPFGYEFFPLPFEQNCEDLGEASLYRDRQACVTAGGVPQGPGTVCTSTLCEEEFRACCAPPPIGCKDLLFETCREAGWIPQASDVHCDDFPCVVTDQACCFDDGQCDDTDPDTCRNNGGMPDGPGSSCGNDSCLGACCPPGAPCEQMMLDECEALGSVYEGLGVSCDSIECLGGCCFLDQLFCFKLSEESCRRDGGTPLPDCEPDAVSGQDPCQFACCLPDGECDVGQTLFECLWTTNARGTTCDDVTCPGRDCPADGRCNASCPGDDPDCDSCGGGNMCIEDCVPEDPDCANVQAPSSAVCPGSFVMEVGIFVPAQTTAVFSDFTPAGTPGITGDYKAVCNYVREDTPGVVAAWLTVRFIPPNVGADPSGACGEPGDTVGASYYVLHSTQRYVTVSATYGPNITVPTLPAVLAEFLGKAIGESVGAPCP